MGAVNACTHNRYTMEVAMIKLMNNCRIGLVFTIDRYLLSNSNYLSKRIDLKRKYLRTVCYSLRYAPTNSNEKKK